jgi:hypothetical protein
MRSTRPGGSDGDTSSIFPLRWSTGSLTFKTDAGKGTTFIIRLPIGDRGSASVAAA